MISVKSKNNILIRLTDERIRHIIMNHPEIKNCIPWVLETIEKPDFILSGDFGELGAVRQYDKTPVTNDKYLTVVYKETGLYDGFILTAYFSRDINRKRKIIWKL
jgi:hypothetical protein